MVSQIFNFPGFFDREIDLTSQIQEPVGVPAGVVGGAERGPAFVPFTVGSFADFRTRFGDLNPRYAAPYAVDKFLENRTALTFIRILGAGANETSSDIETTRTQGTVKNAGFVIEPSASADVPSKTDGTVHFLVARHVVSASEALAMPMFTDNNSITGSTTDGINPDAYLVRGVIFAATGTRIQVMDWNENYSVGSTGPSDDIATVSASLTPSERIFKIVISASNDPSFGTDDGNSGIRILTASLDPSSDNYFAKLLNTDPERFFDEKHVVYADYAVDAELASVGTGSGDVGIASGSHNDSDTSGDTTLTWLNAFGRFDTRYTTPKTSWFISQPYGTNEYDLFYVEAVDDGAYANQKFKISITNILKSSNVRDKHGTFTLVVRSFDDTDVDPEILEQFNNLSLDPDSDNYIAKVIGDKRARFNFDAEAEEDRRILTTGKYQNRSRLIRVVMSEQVEQKKIPEDAVPFGFRGVSPLNTNSILVDTSGSAPDGLRRLYVSGASDVSQDRLQWAIVPPLPFVYKVTRGNANTSPGFEGAPGNTELADARYYWGVKFTRNSTNGNALNPNIVNLPNNLVKSYTKFAGIEKLDVLVTGSRKDNFNDNKFTLARVALGNSALADVTSSAATHMKEAAYLRNRNPDGFEYKVTDDISSAQRITFATLYQKGTTAADFNKFTNYAKFTTVMYGGFDGVNILDKNAATFNDRATSTETRASDGAIGNAAASFVSPGLRSNVNGFGTSNQTIFSYRVASQIITDAITSNINLLAVPGQRDPLVTDFVGDEARDFGLAFYTMDVPNYDSNGDRIWDGENSRFIDVEQVANSFEQRALDNEFVGAYFPDFTIEDDVNRRRVTVPASIGALAALGFNDRVAYPWFAPAGFNRAALDFVTNTKARIKQPERERLYDIHINPIVKFPGEPGFVIFAQNTLEQAETALGSINVVRMLNELKRQIIEIGNRTIFEQITPEIYTELDRRFRNVLNLISARAGIERFDVIVDDRNNTDLDRENNKVNARIVLVPTRAIEFVAIDFIITRSGVSFDTV